MLPVSKAPASGTPGGGRRWLAAFLVVVTVVFTFVLLRDASTPTVVQFESSVTRIPAPLSHHHPNESAPEKPVERDAMPVEHRAEPPPATIVEEQSSSPPAASSPPPRTPTPPPFERRVTDPVKPDQPPADLALVPPQQELDDELGRVLKAAAMPDRTVLLTSLNGAWASPGSMIDLFLESFRSGNGTQELLRNLIIVAMDEKAHARCASIHPHCYALATHGVDFSEDKFFMTPGYLALVWQKIDFLRVVLERGYNFVFADADIMWFRNPFPHFFPDADLQVACDQFRGSSTDMNVNSPNTGFQYARSNDRTISFYRFWYASRERNPQRHDQDAFNEIKYDPIVRDIGLRMRFLSTEFFGGICEPSRDLGKVCTMHANCCVGLGRKLHDLRVMIEDWKRYMAWKPIRRSTHLFSWSSLQLDCLA